MTAPVLMAAILELAPGCAAVIRGDDLEGLQWLDDQVARPTDDAILQRAREIMARPRPAPAPTESELLRALWAHVVDGDQTQTARLRAQIGENDHEKHRA